MAAKPSFAEILEKFRAIVAERNLGEEAVRVTVGTLTVEQAIGSPQRQDYPLQEGKEVMVEAAFRGSYGQAFTDRPHDFRGTLNEILAFDPKIRENRAVFIATLNAVMAHLGKAAGTRHCRDEEPEECADEICAYILEKYGRVRVGLIGLQPAILENLASHFGADNVKCTDLNPKNIGNKKFGAAVWDGRTDTGKLVDWCDLVLATSSTLVNDSFDVIREEAAARGKPLLIFGVTGAGVAALLSLERVCFRPHD